MNSIARQQATEWNDDPSYWDVTPVLETDRAAVYYCCTFGYIERSRVVAYRLMGDGCWATVYEDFTLSGNGHMSHWRVAECIGSALNAALKYL
jgi:hypothetical protein